MFVGGDGGGVSPEWEGVKVLFLCLLMRGRETEREVDRPRERVGNRKMETEKERRETERQREAQF